MEIKITGRIARVLPQRGGTTSKGTEWASQEFIITDDNGKYPSSLIFQVFGKEKIEKFALKEGETVTVFLDAETHEFNGRVFNNISCWKVEREPQPIIDAQIFQPTSEPQATPQEDDLPF